MLLSKDTLLIASPPDLVDSDQRWHRPLQDLGLRMDLVRTAAKLTLAFFSLAWAGCNGSRDAVSKRDVDSATAVPSSSRPGKTEPASLPAQQRAAHDNDWFEDVTPASGVTFSYRNGREAGRFTILETVGGGLGIADFDGDGLADLFCVGGGTIDRETGQPSGVPCGLFQQQSPLQFIDVTAAAGLGDATDYSHGCVVGDVDNDGFPDLFLTSYGRCSLFVNRGDGTFIDETVAAGLNATSWSTAAALGDIDSDGALDLFVTGYVDWQPRPDEVCRNNAGSVPDVCPPQNYRPLPDRLYRNQSDGRFEDISEEAGIRRDGMGLGVVAADVNHDGRVDFYVANDVVANHLYLGAEGGRLIEAGEVSGVAYNEGGTPEGSMGIDVEDVDGDGLPELWVTNFELEDNSLYRNLGEGAFQHAVAAFGLAGRGRPWVKFGTGLCDFDSDGRPDLYVLSGHVRYHTGIYPFEQPAQLFRNVEGRRFEEVTAAAGPWFDVPHAARGGATGDLDGDGALDLAVSSLSEPIAVLRNRRPPHHWVRLRLIGTASSRDSIGARVMLTAFGRTCVRQAKSGAGYLSQSDPRLLFALEAEASSADVSVVWPSGLSERFSGLRTNADHVMIEGRGQPAGDR